jgi:hypothetical protein
MARRTKYNNVPTTIDGIRFPSKREAARYGELKLLERAREIEELFIQPKFTLFKAHDNDPKPITYKADFAYYEVKGDGRLIVEDVKGFETERFKLIRRLFVRVFPQHDFRIFR